MLDPWGNPSRAWRNHSLIRRFTRLRITELPTRLLTVTPSLLRILSDSLESPSVRGAIAMTKLFEVPRFPDLTTRIKSRVDRIRSTCRKWPVLESIELFRRNTSCEALPAFRTASLEYCTSGMCFSSRTKSVDSLSSNTAWLISAFHRRPSVLVGSRVEEITG